MTTVAHLVRRGLRLHGAGWAVVATLTALTLTVSVGAVLVAGATLGAHTGLLTSIDAADVTIGIGVPEGFGPSESVLPEQVAALDGVARMSVVRNTVGTQVSADGRFDPAGTTALIVAVEGAPALPLLRGRLPTTEAADEVALSEGAADVLGADLGDRIRYAVLTLEEVEQVEQAGADRGGTIVDPVVVGVFGPSGLDGPDQPAGPSTILASGAFLEAHPGIGTYQVASVWLADGVTTARFVRSLEAGLGSGLDVGRRSDVEADVRRAVQPEAYALLAFAGAAALAGLVITAQAIARQLATGDDEATLLALGVRRRQRAVARGGQALIAIAVGASLGIAAGVIAGRSVGATGIAATFQVTSAPGPGLVPPVTAGLGLTMAVLVAAGALSWRGARVRRPEHRATSGWSDRLLGSAPLGLRVGAALASRGSGAERSARTAVAGTAMSVAVIVGVIVAASSLDALTSTPALYGADYDLAAWDGYGAVEDDAITEALEDEPDVVGISITASSTGAVGGVEADLMGLSDPSIGPRLTGGRAPTSPREVVLGRRLARRLGVGIGGTATVAAGDRQEPFVVVGTGVLPGGQGDGAAFTLEGLLRVVPDAAVSSQFVRLGPDADQDAVVDRFVRTLGCMDDCELSPPSTPVDLAYLDRIGSFPRWSVGTMLAVGIAMTIHALTMVGRRSRRPLAVLRALGATRRQVAGYLVSQASLIVVTGAVAGLAIGAVAGRAVWLRVADALGVVPSPRGGVAATTLAVAVLVVLAVAVAAVPSRRAASSPAAVALHAD